MTSADKYVLARHETADLAPSHQPAIDAPVRGERCTIPQGILDAAFDRDLICGGRYGQRSRGPSRPHMALTVDFVGQR